MLPVGLNSQWNHRSWFAFWVQRFVLKAQPIFLDAFHTVLWSWEVNTPILHLFSHSEDQGINGRRSQTPVRVSFRGCRTDRGSSELLDCRGVWIGELHTAAPLRRRRAGNDRQFGLPAWRVVIVGKLLRMISVASFGPGNCGAGHRICGQIHLVGSGQFVGSSGPVAHTLRSETFCSGRMLSGSAQTHAGHHQGLGARLPIRRP